VTESRQCAAVCVMGYLQMSDSKGPSHKPSFQCVVKMQKPGPKPGSETSERYVGEGANKKVRHLYTHRNFAEKNPTDTIRQTLRESSVLMYTNTQPFSLIHNLFLIINNFFFQHRKYPQVNGAIQWARGSVALMRSAAACPHNTRISKFHPDSPKKSCESWESHTDKHGERTQD